MSPAVVLASSPHQSTFLGGLPWHTPNPSLTLRSAPALIPREPRAVDEEFEARWAAWRARGAAHDRAVRRRFSLVAPLVAITVGIIGFLSSR